MGGVIKITDDQFKKEVLQEENQPVLVYFWASWCGPCRLMSPSIDAAAEKYGDRLKIIKMEVDAHPEIAKQYKIEGVPALRFFQKGQIVTFHEGAINKQKLFNMIEDHL